MHFYFENYKKKSYNIFTICRCAGSNFRLVTTRSIIVMYSLFVSTSACPKKLKWLKKRRLNLILYLQCMDKAISPFVEIIELTRNLILSKLYFFVYLKKLIFFNELWNSIFNLKMKTKILCIYCALFYIY